MRTAISLSAKYILLGLTFISVRGMAQPERSGSLAGLSDTSVTRETIILFNQLKEISKTGVIFGHQHASYFGQNWMNSNASASFSSDCFRSVEDHPGVFGFDLNRGMSLFKDQVIEIFLRGGIVTFSDHAPNPVTGGDSWDNDGNAIGEALVNPEYWKSWTDRLDRTADFFNSLEVNGIKVPVIYRPLHEHTGKWFWWGVGNCTEEEYVDFWRRTIDYLRIDKGVTNMLVAISPSNPGDKQQMTYDSYPGDDYVDIIGFDMYSKDATYAAAITRNARFVTNWARDKKKVAAITETGISNGLQNSTSDNFFTAKLLAPLKNDTANTDIAYVLTWSNFRPDSYWVPLPGQPNYESFIEFHNDPFTLFLDELVDIYENPFGYSYYDVTIKSIDKVTGQPIEKAQVSLNKKDQTTGQDGTTVFVRSLERFSFNVSHEDYYDYVLLDQFITSDTTFLVEMEPYKNQLVIMVNDQQTGEAVDGCILYFQEDSTVSGLDGEAEIALYDGTYEWALVRTNYHSTSGSLSIDNDTTLQVSVLRSHANLKFRLREEGLPVKEASVILVKDTMLTNPVGTVEFLHLQVDTPLAYIVMKEGYDTIFGQLVLQSDSTLELEMTKPGNEIDTTSSIQKSKGMEFSVYPNPADEQLFISGLRNKGPITAGIYNLAGQQVCSFQGIELLQGINIKPLAPGIYILKIQAESSYYHLPFLKGSG